MNANRSNRPLAAARTSALAVMLACVAGLGLAGCSPTPDKPQGAAPAVQESVRLGTYDTRAVALAYGRSAKFGRSMTDLRAEHAKAKQAGDAARVAELEEQGQMRQARLHLQVFSNAPADDGIAAIKDKLAEVARRVNVSAIVPAAEYHAGSVVLVDVTGELVALFDPTPETLAMALDIKRHPPEPIEKIAAMPVTE